jgi:hypothetical protein
MPSPNVSVRRDAQTELDEPITIRWTGRLRGRIQERQWDYVASKNDDGEWVVAEEHYGDDADDLKQCNALAYRALTRQKTNVVIETVDEAKAVYRVLDYYKDGAGRHGITWMNGPMEKAARRVRREIRVGLDERGHQI